MTTTNYSYGFKIDYSAFPLIKLPHTFQGFTKDSLLAIPSRFWQTAKCILFQKEQHLPYQQLYTSLTDLSTIDTFFYFTKNKNQLVLQTLGHSHHAIQDIERSIRGYLYSFNNPDPMHKQVERDKIPYCVKRADIDVSITSNPLESRTIPLYLYQNYMEWDCVCRVFTDRLISIEIPDNMIRQSIMSVEEIFVMCVKDALMAEVSRTNLRLRNIDNVHLCTQATTHNSTILHMAISQKV